MASCIIDGKRCTKCCEAITMPEVTPAMYGPDPDFVRLHMTQISEDEARAINPYLFSLGRNYAANGWVYYRCEFSSPAGCTNYDERPAICSGYPFYGRTLRDGKGNELTPDYHPRCTEFPVVIPVVNITA